MVFTSITFIFIFLPIVLIIYFIALLSKNIRLQNIVLLTTSFIFYAWGGLQYIVIIVTCILLNYTVGLLIAKGNSSRFCLMAGVAGNIAMLGFFKYFNFFTSNIEALIRNFDSDYAMNAPIIPLPIGISFFIFQGMSYIIDVYRKDVRAQKNVFYLALYIILFPQLIAGPIVRYSDIENAVTDRSVSIENIYHGIVRFMYGFTKKMLLANKMGYIADTIFAQMFPNTLYAWIGIITYALQIFLDFSAYSDMAIGLGEVFGFEFMENFNYPYISKSIREFWRRWHISLSSWFRDYVYIPLGGSRKGTVRTYRNLLIVFFLTGFWHGASWNFIVWGMWYGIFLVLERLFLGRILDRLPALIQWLYTIFIVLIGWVFFRADTLSIAVDYLKIMFSINFSNWTSMPILLMADREYLVWIVIALLINVPISLKFLKGKAGIMVRDIMIVASFGLSLCYLLISDFNPFIYFRF